MHVDKMIASFVNAHICFLSYPSQGLYEYLIRLQRK